jgi:asparagine synthase (glutamine-hydrolysing)
LAGIERHHALHHEPGHAAANTYWIAAILEEAKARGLGALLIGQDGNMVVSWTGGPLPPWHYLLNGQWRRFQRASTESFKASAFWQTLRRTVINPIRGSSLARSMPLFTWENSAIHPALVARLKLRQYQDDANYMLTYKAKNGAHPIRYATLKPGGNIAGSHWANWAAGYGLEVRDPTADKRLLEFCFAIPNAQYRQGGQDRALIRRGMAGVLPDEIRLNTHRGQQAADIIYRVRSNQTQIESVLDRLEQSTLASEYLDLLRMRSTLKAAIDSVDSQSLHKVDTILLRGLSVGVFLLELEAANNPIS